MTETSDAMCARHRVDSRPPLSTRRDATPTQRSALSLCDILIQEQTNKMNQRDDNNLVFVAEIEKYEFLYNFNMPEYNRKDVTDGAWGEIAKKMGLTGK